MNNKLGYGGILVAIVLAITALFLGNGPAASNNVGGVTNYDEVDSTAIKVGTNGSRVGPVIASTCSLIMPNYTSLVASSTIPADCAVTGVVTGDIVIANFATSTVSGALGAGWQITGASASSTSGFITFSIINNTGAARTIPASTASGTPFIVLHPLSAVPGL